MNIECFHYMDSSMVKSGVPSSIKVLLIHPEKIFLEALAEALPARDDLNVVPFMDNSLNAYESLSDHQPDVVVMGMVRIDPKVIDDLQRLASICQKTSVVVFSDLQEAWQIRSVFDAGVRGCVSLSAGLSDLVCAIRSTFEGRMYMCAESVQRMLHAQSSCISLRPDGILGHREGEVLRLIADGYSSKEIARNLNITPGTVDVHRRNIMRKVGLHKVADLTRYALRNQMVGL